MKFGVFSVVDHYPKELPRTTARFYGELFEQVEAAEALGFESFWVAEHHFHEYGAIPPAPDLDGRCRPAHAAHPPGLGRGRAPVR